MALGKFKLALRDFESVKKAKPRDPDAQVHYNLYTLGLQRTVVLVFRYLV